MSKKIIDSKLENLFLNINGHDSTSDDIDLESVGSFGTSSNWAWEIDINGIIISCGKEISDVLGFSPLDVIGQPFFSFGLRINEQQKLRDSINSAEFPIDLELNYNSRDGLVQHIRTSIVQNFDPFGTLIGYKCFSQKIFSDEENLKLLDELVEKFSSTPQIVKENPEAKKEDFHTRPLTNFNLSQEPDILEVSKKNADSEKPKVIKPRKPASMLPEMGQKPLGKTAPLPPITFPASENGRKVTIAPTEITGLTLTDDGFSVADKSWSAQTGSESENDQLSIDSAVISVPIKLRDQKTGFLEIFDSQQNRKWSEEDRLLIQEVTNQLGLALENAQLYSAVQKELGDRVKAEEETSKRNKALAKLNMVMQQLTRLVSRDEIFEIVSKALIDLFSTDNLLISLFDSSANQLSFPVCFSDGELIHISPRSLGNGFQESILESRTSLLMGKNLSTLLKSENFDHPKGIPSSLLAAPLLAGDRVLGVISIFDYKKENAFDEILAELLSTVAGQTTTALENTNLFHEISEALDTIEIRERYQANVTNAVAALSEKGSSTVDFLLESLAVAAKCDRVSYVNIIENPKDNRNWKILSSFTVAEKASSFMSVKNLSIQILPEWSEELKQKGSFYSTIDTASDREKAFLDELKTRSILLLGLNIGRDLPTFLMLEDLTYPRVWKSEEINILSIASDAFRNTLLREDLLHQVQTSLDETENLYAASHRLALANSLPEMISSIVEGINIPFINRGILVLFEYDLNHEIEKMSVSATYYNGKGTPPPPTGTEYLISLYKPIFVIEHPVFYDDLLDAEIDDQLRKIFTSQNVRSMGILPLWSGNVQLGVLLIQTGQKHRFGPQEMRSFPPLADQMSTAIENQRLFEQTQAALAETGLLYKISSGISQSSSFEEYLKLVSMNAMPDNADMLWLLTSGQQIGGSPQYYEVVGSSTINGEFQPHGGYVEATLFDFVDFSKSEPVLISNVKKSNLSELSQNLFRSLNLSSFAVIPLHTTGGSVGMFIMGSKSLAVFETEDVQTLQIVGNSIAIAIERHNLLSETQRRALELQTAAEIARDTTSTLSLDILLKKIVELIRDRFDFYHCSIFLLDEANEYAVVRESTGEAGEEMKRRKHKLAVGSKSIIGSCTASGEVVIVNDTKNNPLYYPNPLLPATRSELGLPLKISGKVIGAIDLQSTRREAFDVNALSVLQIQADQIAIAVENARAYEISQQAVEEMRELDRVKSQFLANMSHELRTPLNSVIGFSRVILKGIDGPINDTQEQDITAIYNSGMHLLNMINEILDLSKIEAGKMELQIDDINISDVINAAITNTTGLIKDKPIELIQKVSSNLPTIQADEVRISQVLINLISNAIKFTDKGSITVEAVLQNNPQNKPEVLFTVTDTGIGIAKEDQSKLFQRFSQVDDSPTRKTGGTGLGLSICRSMVELHGGKIGLMRSEVGKGSTFYFTIPAPDTTHPTDFSHLIRGENVILSIDDDAQVISLYDRFLRPHGYEVVPLTDPTQAVEKAIEIQPFAITLDIMMPQKDGWHVLNDLKKNKVTRNIPILICSILEEEEKGFNLGASDYLVKPFLQDDLASAIHRLNKDGEIHDVLIVDDDPADLRLLQKMIEDEGKYMAVMADGGQSALKLLKDFTPDIILLDLFMPDLNGFELIDKLKSDPRLSRIPAIILTGADLSMEQHKLLSEYGDQILTKGSLHENDLLHHLQETLNKIRPTKLVN